MPIVPLPVFEADADPRHRDGLTLEEQAAALPKPSSLVVRFGAMKMIAELPYDGDLRPGCGSKLVARTHRGTEVVELLTTTCSNGGCGQSVSRKELLQYIDNSGGRDYPFHTKGRVLRVATIDDLNRQSELEGRKPEWTRLARRLIEHHRLPMKLVDVEPILGGEVLTFYYLSEDRVDFRELVRDLATELATRVELRQVGARDEARLVADYERCGQYCCCKNFLKVLKPVSMTSAKVQKATLDPIKISGRCGRLMCCLRYEDQTYRELKAKLPARRSRVGTAEGPGIVIDSKILVQLVLVQLEADGREIAVPVEELMDPENCPKPKTAAERAAEFAAADPLRGMPVEQVAKKVETGETPPERRKKRRRGGRGRRRDKAGAGDADGGGSGGGARSDDAAPSDDASRTAPTPRAPEPRGDAGAEGSGAAGKSRRRSRRSRRRRGGGKGGGSESPEG